MNSTKSVMLILLTVDCGSTPKLHPPPIYDTKETITALVTGSFVPDYSSPEIAIRSEMGKKLITDLTVILRM